jgi:hypothetical protein
MKRRSVRCKKVDRLAHGWLNIAEVAAELNTSPETLRYHVTMGYCQRPTKRIGNRLFYTRETYPRLKEYWTRRQLHQHHPRSYKYARPINQL